MRGRQVEKRLQGAEAKKVHNFKYIGLTVKKNRLKRWRVQAG